MTLKMIATRERRNPNTGPAVPLNMDYAHAGYSAGVIEHCVDGLNRFTGLPDSTCSTPSGTGASGERGSDPQPSHASGRRPPSSSRDLPVASHSASMR